MSYQPLAITHTLSPTFPRSLYIKRISEQASKNISELFSGSGTFYLAGLFYL